MTKTIAEIFAENEAHQARIAAEYWARKARREAAWAEHIANLHTAGDPPPTLVGALAPMSDYHTSVARGWSTE
jgi:Zn-dependent oligopeptidase